MEGFSPAKPDFLAAAFHAPARPEGVAFVEGGAGAGVLAGQAADAGGDVLWYGSVRVGVPVGQGSVAGDADGFLARCGGEGDVAFLPPVKFGDIGDARGGEPGFVAQRDEEVDVWVAGADAGDGRVVHVVVVVVGDDDGVDG